MRRLAALLTVLASATVARADADSLNHPLGPRELAVGEGVRAGATGAMATTLNPAGRDAFVQWVRTPAERRDAGAAARSVRAAEPLFARLDAHLATQPFMTGAQLGIADFPIGCELHRWFGLPAALYSRPSWPNLERYFAGLRTRPAARGVLDLALE